MELSADDFRIIRSWVGTAVLEADLVERALRLGSIESVIEETLQTQLTVLGSSPTSIRLPSGLSISTDGNIKFLEARLRLFRGNRGGVIRELRRSDLR